MALEDMLVKLIFFVVGNIKMCCVHTFYDVAIVLTTTRTSIAIELFTVSSRKLFLLINVSSSAAVTLHLFFCSYLDVNCRVH